MAEGGGEAVTATETNSLIQTKNFAHDWYQTETHVVVAILFKNTKFDPNSVKVEYGETTLSINAKLANGSDYNMELDLAHPVVPSNSSHKVYSTKIEVKLKKADGIRWSELQGNPKAPEVVKPIPQEILNSGPPKYPSSAPKSKDWDRVVKELDNEEEKPEGDAALNALFQNIYEQGTDEVKRAMNKSFQESGGTVLSTNWKEVAKEKVDVKTPDGMEFRKWES